MLSVTWLLPFLALTTGATDVVSGNHASENLLLRRDCVRRLQRKSWSSLADWEKRAYIDAELCLMRKPPRYGFPNARSIFDELQGVHVWSAEIIHFVGAFLPWHRYFIYMHEYLLRTECGYGGAQPYWDEPRDADRFAQADIFHPNTGFGGGGRGPGNCVSDGPFAWYVNSYGPGHRVQDHCIDRLPQGRFDERHSRFAQQRFADRCLGSVDFEDATDCLELNPHSAAHLAVGGQMANVISSTGDPIFYLHHAYLDKLFWQWQARNLPARLHDVAGPNLNEACAQMRREGRWADGPPCPSRRMEPVGREGDWGGEWTTLDHRLFMFGIVPNVTIRDVMDIGGGTPLCYEYL